VIKKKFMTNNPNCRKTKTANVIKFNNYPSKLMTKKSRMRGYRSWRKSCANSNPTPTLTVTTSIPSQ